MVHTRRKRYIVFHVASPDNIGKGMLIKLIRDRTRDLPKETFDRIKPWFVYYANGWAILRCGHSGRDRMIEIIRSLNGMNLREGTLIINISGVSGTLKGAFNKFIPRKAREGEHYRKEMGPG